MPFCTQCAHALTEGARFCPGCGAATAPAAAPATVPAAGAAADLTRDVTRTSTERPAGAHASAPPVSAGGVHGRFEPGTRIGNRYRVVALLGRGGMGEVYRADDLELGQSVALKFLPQAVAGSSAELARFRSEVRVARQIAHANVCRVYDIGEADGHVFISMEYIDGEDLASVLRRMGRPSADKAIEIARQICFGLAAAHEAGMLHRDLKPANIMIDGRGRARITDFGLAGLADELAKESGFAGTPAYMAPEQLSGGRVSVRSDIYALGLVLYEIFTGKRVFSSKSIAEIKQMHDSASLTSPSELVRDLDPAVDRIITHCLESDPELRPASAYAVLGALPGGDPLAAALAAGETPSPELVANAGDKGSLTPLVAFGCIAAGLLGIALWAGLTGPEFRVAKQPTQVLSVRATDILGKTGGFGQLPDHTVEGFGQSGAYLEYLRSHKQQRVNGASAIFFWRRWSPRIIESPSIHTENPGVNDPPLLAAGQATVLLDPAGRLIGLEAIPADSAKFSPGATPQWGVLLEAAGLDTAALTPAALVRPVPATCDSAAAWAARLPWAANEQVTVQAGASRGRLVHFTMVHNWGRSTAPVDSLEVQTSGGVDWGNFLVFALLPLIASVYFGARNLKLGRGDRRGATRIAVFVFCMNILESAFTTRLSEDGLLSAGADWVSGRAFGHSLMHSVSMWFAYVALEPYIRKLWPRMLVSWTRLISGRLRDPLVGRDLLIGGVAGIAVVALGALAVFATRQLGFASVPTLVNDGMLESLTGIPTTLLSLAYGGSVCVLQVLETLLLLLMLKLLLRRTWLAVVVSLLLSSGSNAMSAAPYAGWVLAILGAAVYLPSIIFVLMRFGLLAATTAMFVTLVMGSAVATLDFSAWYADRALVSMVTVGAILAFGAATALAGKTLFGDPLHENAGR